MELFRQKQNEKFTKLEITGRSDEGFERVFNAEEIVDKVAIEARRRDDGLFDEDSVFGALIDEIS